MEVGASHYTHRENGLISVSERLAEAEWNVVGSTEMGLQVSPTRVRVPDLVLLRPGAQRPILTKAPLLVIEILSAGDLL